MTADAEMAKINRDRAAKLRRNAAGVTNPESVKKMLRSAEEFEEIAEGYENLAHRIAERRKA